LKLQRLIAVIASEFAACFINIDAESILLNEQVGVVASLLCECFGLFSSKLKQRVTVANVLTQQKKLMRDLIFRSVPCKISSSLKRRKLRMSGTLRYIQLFGDFGDASSVKFS
jgi:hypothetical protein